MKKEGKKKQAKYMYAKIAVYNYWPRASERLS